MCGIAGVVWKATRRTFDVSQALRVLGDAIAHRGPDGNGIYESDKFAVVHRRLAIIDLAKGHQPMILDEGRIGIVYNGEIYNHQELREELERKGYEFETSCDTEVFLKLYAAEGADGFPRLEGMFAAFIWDVRNPDRPLFYLIRDHFGVKPLYLYEDADCYVFASEISALAGLRDLDFSPSLYGLASYLTFRYVQAPYTAFARVRRIEAGTYVRIANGHSLDIRYWDVPVAASPLRIGIDEAASELRSLLRHSVQQQQMSDVPVGLLLSGGMDSSVIAVLCREVGASLASFNIGFPDLNEFQFSDEVAQKFELPHFKYETTPQEIANRFESVVSAMDDLIADPACFPLYILCEVVKQHVTVLLSGEGSDEMLAGYPQYRRVVNDNPAPLHASFEHFLSYSEYFSTAHPPILGRPFPSRIRTNRKYFDQGFLLEGMLAYDQKTWLPENLMMKADKILMAHSLEGRFPFLSTKLVEFISQLPQEMKIGCEQGKTILRHAFRSDLPQSVRGRKKMGFSVPVADLLREMKDRFYDLAGAGQTGHFAGVLDHGAIARDMDDYFAGRNSQSLRMWTLLVMFQWMDSVQSGRLTSLSAAA